MVECSGPARLSGSDMTPQIGVGVVRVTLPSQASFGTSCAGSSPSVDHGRGRPMPAQCARGAPALATAGRPSLALACREPTPEWDKMGLSGIPVCASASAEKKHATPAAVILWANAKKPDELRSPDFRGRAPTISACADKTRPALDPPDQSAWVILCISEVFLAMVSSCFGRLDRSAQTTR